VTLKNAEAIVEFLTSEGIEATVYEEYSGRGMFGSTTSGVVTSQSGDVAFAMGSLGIKERPQQDSMGLDVILY